MRTAVLIAWAACGAFLVACEAASLTGTHRWAGSRRLLDVLSASTGRQAAAFVIWMFVGWHFFAR